jgi:hypothetical protein
MTQYLLAVHHAGNGPDLTPEEMQQSFADTEAVTARMMDTDVFVFGGGLQPVESATVVRRSGDGMTITDGPYLETKEHLGGFWIINVADLDAALDWAKQATVACRAPIEVRPFDAIAGASAAS